MMNTIFYLGASENFYVHLLLIWVELDISELQHKMLLSICEFSENWCREGCIFLMDINNIILCRYCKTV
jgi:hypothetical protein